MNLSRLDTPRLRRWRRDGLWLGVAGAVLLGAAGALRAVAIPALREEAAAACTAAAAVTQRADARRLATGSRAARGAMSSAPPPLDRLLPEAGQRHLHLAALLDAARAHGLTAPRTEGRWLPEAQVARYEIAMPVQGEYTQIRSFIADALQADPVLSLDALHLHRTDADAPRVDADLRWSVHLRAENGS